MSCILLDISPADVIQAVFEAKNEAEKNREPENKAATKIEAWWKKCMAQSRYRLMQASAIKIQKVWRGYSKGRKIYLEMKQEKETKMKFQFFHSCAAKIQRMWKGHYHRKKYLNFAERNQFLNEADQQSQFVQEMLRVYAEKQKERLKKEEEEKNAKKVEAMAKNMHHLVSTKAIKGVFQPFQNVEQTLHKTAKIYSPLKNSMTTTKLSSTSSPRTTTIKKNEKK